MRISKFEITLMPSDGEIHPPVTIYRTEKKEWVAKVEGLPRGLFPSEIKLISLIQEQVIDVWPKKA